MLIAEFADLEHLHDARMTETRGPSFASEANRRISSADAVGPASINLSATTRSRLICRAR